MKRDEIECFFNLCATQSKGYLSFEEFKDLYNNPEADKLFRFFISRARKVNEQLREEGIDTIYLPFNLSRLLEHMTLRHRRETVIDRIDANEHIFEKTTDTIKNFVKLFIIDQGAMDTISKDQWSRKIADSLRSRYLDEKAASGQ